MGLGLGFGLGLGLGPSIEDVAPTLFRLLPGSGLISLGAVGGERGERGVMASLVRARVWGRVRVSLTLGLGLG